MDLEFLDTTLEYSFLPLYGIVIILAIWRYPRYFDTPLRYFPILLAYTFLNEVLGWFIKHYDDISLILVEFFRNNNWLIFNIYNIIYFLYFFYVFWKYIRRKKFKNFIVLASIIFLIMTILNPFYQSFMVETQLYAYITGALLLISIMLLYFLDLHSEYGFWFLRRDLLSWAGMGMIIFYTGYIPIKILRYYEATEGFNGEPYVRRIHLLLILMMYGCIAVGFLKMRRRRSSIDL